MEYGLSFVFFRYNRVIPDHSLLLYQTCSHRKKYNYIEIRYLQGYDMTDLVNREPRMLIYA